MCLLCNKGVFTQRVRGLVDEGHAVLAHAVVDRLHCVGIILFTPPECLDTCFLQEYKTSFIKYGKVLVEFAILKIACLVCCNFQLFFLGFAFQTFDLVHECGFLDPAVTLGYRVVTSANFNVVNKFFFQCPTLIMVLLVFSLNIDNFKLLAQT